MIQFKTALRILDTSIKITNSIELIDLKSSLNRIVARDYKAPFDSPRINNSSMDGIVINKNDLSKFEKFKIVGECKAGLIKSNELKSGEAKLIFTGGPLPGIKKKLIVIKEECDFCDNFVKIKKIKIKDYIRYKGSNFKKNELCIKKGSVINSRTVSLAYSLNIKNIKVFSKPKVAILTTGDEIKSRENPRGTVFSSNKIMLENLVKIFGGEVTQVLSAKDSKDELNEKINLLKKFDLLISTGGISEGKYDLVKKVLVSKGIKLSINKVAMKPGKPIIFGTFPKNGYYLGLPGNPVSCFIGSIFFLKKILDNFLIQKKNSIFEENAISTDNIPQNNKLTNIQRILIKKKNDVLYFNIIENQDSSLLKTLNDSDGLIIRKPFAKEIKSGEIVKIIRYEKITNNLI